MISRRHVFSSLGAWIVGSVTRLSARDAVETDGRLNATDGEASEGYFALSADGRMIVAQQGSDLHAWLKGHLNQDVRLEVTALTLVLAVSLSGCASRRPLRRLERAIEASPSTISRYDAPMTADLQESWVRCLVAAHRLGVDVQIGDPDQDVPGAAGTFSFTTRIVKLDQRLSVDALAQVLAHELGHALQPDGLTKPESEVFADAVSWLVTRHERNDLPTYATYLASMKTSARPVLRLYAKEITWAAATIWGTN